MYYYRGKNKGEEMNSFWLNSEWSDPAYQQIKKNNFELLDQYLNKPPSQILDIGCGLAWESRMFNKKYGTELWLLDGDSSKNNDKPLSAKDINWHETADDFLFYHTFDVLNLELKKLGTENYKLIDCNNIDIPVDIKFDVITSWLSAGFHYPVSTYKELILKHSHENTKIIIDVRTHVKTKQLFLEPGIEVVNVLQERRKASTIEIKFK
jgi:SAM-dependent methyltransferase